MWEPGPHASIFGACRLQLMTISIVMRTPHLFKFLPGGDKYICFKGVFFLKKIIICRQDKNRFCVQFVSLQAFMCSFPSKPVFISSHVRVITHKRTAVSILSEASLLHPGRGCLSSQQVSRPFSLSLSVASLPFRCRWVEHIYKSRRVLWERVPR